MLFCALLLLFGVLIIFLKKCGVFAQNQGLTVVKIRECDEKRLTFWQKSYIIVTAGDNSATI